MKLLAVHHIELLVQLELEEDEEIGGKFILTKKFGSSCSEKTKIGSFDIKFSA